MKEGGKGARAVDQMLKEPASRPTLPFTDSGTLCKHLILLRPIVITMSKTILKSDLPISQELPWGFSLKKGFKLLCFCELSLGNP